MSTYTYTALDRTRREFRLLTLPPSWAQPNDGPLMGRLNHYYLPDETASLPKRILQHLNTPLFQAVSYVWGDPTPTHEIFIDCERVLITASLDRALREQQNREAAEFKVWADAICINQDDAVEKSAQIRLMGQIYYLAASVGVSLGPDTENSRRCMKALNYLALDVVDDFENVVEAMFRTILSKTPMASFPRLQILLQTLLLWCVGIADDILFGAFIHSIQMLYAAFSQRIHNLPDVVISLNHHDCSSLRREVDKKLQSWRPRPKGEAKFRDGEDISEIAQLVENSLLSDSNWFGRMWVVQEACFADFVSFQSRENFRGMSGFLNAVYYLDSISDYGIPGLRNIIGLQVIRKAWADGKRLSLRELLRECRNRHATDPRDKIYALLGLMADQMNELLQPDYSKPFEEVYANTTFHLITRFGSLDPICGQQTEGRHGGLPSWVPDFTLDQELTASPLVSVDGEESIYHASGTGDQSIFHLEEAFLKSQSWKNLACDGVVIDTVSAISNLAEKADTILSMLDEWTNALMSASKASENFKHDSSLLAKISQAVSQANDYSSSINQGPVTLTVENIPTTPNTTLKIADIKNDTITYSFINTLFCGRISRERRLRMHHIYCFLAHKSTKIMSLALAALEEGMRRRRLALTNAGYLAATPDATEVGDIICILSGCSVPVILRKTATEEGIEGHTFVGECYVDGFMDGEALKEVGEGKHESRGFVLC